MAMARNVLIAQGALLGGLALALLVREFPGLIREIRIIRMMDDHAGAR
ncbi:MULTISPECIES: hypothetical protein [unclassified Streptomyces]|uniref:Uncharacterized protein n=1 Tax=Streptomyces hazeniae TaxID=3075538 RepID=A0ABU2NMQ6_9ACTN|nr:MULTISPECIES: hypothetical protein [unclassified Streptomyces]MDT0378275.1 hypothetical protein [Streptomyces sp. DSM 42041]